MQTTMMSEIPRCDFCLNPAAYDGKTRMGSWAYMCKTHFEILGLGLGMGLGQEWKKGGEKNESKHR